MTDNDNARLARRLAAFLAVRSAVFLLAVAPAAQAKDLYVAPNGNDDVSHADNSPSAPWQTINRALSGVANGDTLFLRAGTYTPAAKIDIRTNGSEITPIKITSFPGETATIDLANIFWYWLELNGSYWEISNLEFVNAQVVAEVSLSATTTGNVFRNNRISMNRGGDNFAAFMIEPRATDVVIDGNDIVGPGREPNVNSNTGCIYMTRNSHIKVVNNRLSNCPNAIHYKHANSNTPGRDIEIAYNIFRNVDVSLQFNGNYAHIHDNIFGPDSGFAFIGVENGVPGGHNNVFDHNTFYGGRLWLVEAGPTGAVQGNVVTNNVFVRARSVYRETLVIVRYPANAQNPPRHHTTLDYNLHPTVDAIDEYGRYYTLRRWRAHYGGSMGSIEAVPVFTGGSSPQTAADYRLESSSPGSGRASDGTDMGARIDLFGSSGQTPVGREPPPSPAAL